MASIIANSGSWTFLYSATPSSARMLQLGNNVPFQIGFTSGTSTTPPTLNDKIIDISGFATNFEIDTGSNDNSVWFRLTAPPPSAVTVLISNNTLTPQVNNGVAIIPNLGGTGSGSGGSGYANIFAYANSATTPSVPAATTANTYPANWFAAPPPPIADQELYKLLGYTTYNSVTSVTTWNWQSIDVDHDYDQFSATSFQFVTPSVGVALFGEVVGGIFDTGIFTLRTDGNTLEWDSNTNAIKVGDNILQQVNNSVKDITFTGQQSGNSYSITASITDNAGLGTTSTIVINNLGGGGITEWSSVTTYDKGDLVLYDPAGLGLFQSKIPNNKNNQPVNESVTFNIEPLTQASPSTFRFYTRIEQLNVYVDVNDDLYYQGSSTAVKLADDVGGWGDIIITGTNTYRYAGGVNGASTIKINTVDLTYNNGSITASSVTQRYSETSPTLIGIVYDVVFDPSNANKLWYTSQFRAGWINLTNNSHTTLFANTASEYAWTIGIHPNGVTGYTFLNTGYEMIVFNTSNWGQQKPVFIVFDDIEVHNIDIVNEPTVPFVKLVCAAIANANARVVDITNDSYSNTGFAYVAQNYFLDNALAQTGDHIAAHIEEDAAGNATFYLTESNQGAWSGVVATVNAGASPYWGKIDIDVSSLVNTFNGRVGDVLFSLTDIPTASATQGQVLRIGTGGIVSWGTPTITGGVWASTTTYSKGVSFVTKSDGTGLYQSLQDNNLNNPLPSVTNTWWRVY